MSLWVTDKHSKQIELLNLKNNTKAVKINLNRKQKQNIENFLTILLFNVEWIIKLKNDYLLLEKEHTVDIILLQETHCLDEHQLKGIWKLAGYIVVPSTFQASYGNVNLSILPPENNIYVTRIRILITKVSNFYKGPAVSFNTNAVPIYNTQQ